MTMNESETLKFAQHFVENHSYEAARAIEELPSDVAGDFLNAISNRASESVLAAMVPYHAARCVEAMKALPAAKYLSDITAQASSRILRQVSSESRQNLLAAMPRHKALYVSLLLSYPQSLVGAWMDPAVYPLDADESVNIAKNKISSQHYSHSVVYVVDNNNHLLGGVSLIDLIQHKDENASLKSIAKDAVTPIFASTTIGRAIKPETWEMHDILPVIDRERQLIGVVRYGDLRRATSSPPNVKSALNDDRNLLGITESFCLGLADLIKTSLEHQHGHGLAQNQAEKE